MSKSIQILLVSILMLSATVSLAEKDSPAKPPAPLDPQIEGLIGRIQPSITALVIVDAQNEFLSSEGGYIGRNKAVSTSQGGASRKLPPPLFPELDRIQALIEAARQKDVLVVYTKWITEDTSGSVLLTGPLLRRFQEMGWTPHLPQGSWESKIIPRLAPEPGDLIIRKTAESAFQGTALGHILKSRHVIDDVPGDSPVGTILLAGVNFIGLDAAIMSGRDAGQNGIGFIPVIDCLIREHRLAQDFWTDHNWATYQLDEILLAWGIDVEPTPTPENPPLFENWDSGQIDPAVWKVHEQTSEGGGRAQLEQIADGDYAFYTEGPTGRNGSDWTNWLYSVRSFPRGDNLRCTFRTWCDPAKKDNWVSGSSVYASISGPWHRDNSSTILSNPAAMIRYYNNHFFTQIHTGWPTSGVAMGEDFDMAFKASTSKETSLLVRVWLGDDNGARCEWSHNNGGAWNEIYDDRGIAASFNMSPVYLGWGTFGCAVFIDDIYVETGFF